MPEFVGKGVCQKPRSGNVQSLRSFLDAIPKNVGNTGGHESFTTAIPFGSGRGKNPKKEPSSIQDLRTPWIEEGLVVVQGTVGPFHLDAGLAKDQTRSLFRFPENLPRQVGVVVNRNRKPNPLFRWARGVPLIVRVPAWVAGRRKRQALQAQGQNATQNATGFAFSAHGIFLLAA
jgi:hypothetical protein